MKDYFIKLFKKKEKPSLLAYNIVWFTNCSWVDKLISFKHIDRYSVQ